jgi:hypothetical protein
MSIMRFETTGSEYLTKVRRKPHYLSVDGNSTNNVLQNLHSSSVRPPRNAFHHVLFPNNAQVADLTNDIHAKLVSMAPVPPSKS